MSTEPTSAKRLMAENPEDPVKKKRKRKIEGKSANDGRTVVPQCHGREIGATPVDVCAGCLGNRDDELAGQPVLLCDGPNCKSEYHLKCCVPEITSVPRGSFLCLDCSKSGSSAYLEAYIDRVHDERQAYDTSLDYVNDRLSSACEDEELIPMSEFDRLTVLHTDTMKFPSNRFPTSQLSNNIIDQQRQRLENDITPKSLVGKPVRLYCPFGDQYHTGRILDFRKARFGGDEFWASNSPIANQEFLILFPAGTEGRKTSYKAWLVLEEYSCAVGIAVVWGLISPGKGIKGWRPAMVYARTSMELVSVQEQLSPEQHQIYYIYGSQPRKEHPTWGLAQFLLTPSSQYALLKLQDECVDFFSVAFTHLRQMKGKMNTEKKMNLSVNLALCERREEDRVKNWRDRSNACHIPPFHAKALSAIDYDSMGPVPWRTDMEEADAIVQPCPLLPKPGIDRQWLLDRLGADEQQATSIGLGLSSRIIGISAAILSQYREQELQAQFRRSQKEANTSATSATSAAAKS